MCVRCVCVYLNCITCVCLSICFTSRYNQKLAAMLKVSQMYAMFWRICWTMRRHNICWAKLCLLYISHVFLCSFRFLVLFLYFVGLRIFFFNSFWPRFGKISTDKLYEKSKSFSVARNLLHAKRKQTIFLYASSFVNGIKSIFFLESIFLHFSITFFLLFFFLIFIFNIN